MDGTMRNSIITDTITIELIEEALRRRKQTTDIKVKNISLSPGGHGGNHFTSIIVCVKAVVQIARTESTEHLFIKLAHKGGFTNYWNTTVNIFTKESHVYMDVISAMHDIQIKKSIKHLGPSVPLHYHSVIKKDGGIVILENLVPIGYKMVDTREKMDRLHCTLVMKELARFHALSFALKNGNPHNMEKFQVALEECFFTQPFPDIFTTPIKISLSIVKNLTDDPSIIAAAEKLKAIDCEKLILDIIKPKEPHALICHGDCKLNNMLFKYETAANGTSPVDVKLFDLQGIRYALPATDLVFFFYAGLTGTLRKELLKDMLAVYHQALHEELRRLEMDYPDFTLPFLEQQYKECALLGVMMACIGIISRLRKSDDTGVEKKDNAQFLSDLIKQTFSIQENRDHIKAVLIGAIADVVEMGLL